MNFLEEVCDLITTGIFLPSLRKIPVTDRYHVITDYDKALEMPEIGGISYLVCDFENIKSESYYWNNIRENEVRKINKILYDKNMMEEFNSVVDRIDVYSMTVTSYELKYVDIFDAIEYDMSALLACGIVYPEGNEFYRDIYAVYRDGGWPCGWEDGNKRIFAYFNLEK